ncbi:MAG: hypothetical protein CVU43_18115 [Chloroflexi bacterium HGW-Chloroflexi-5]|jgi:hypothetical protein|nr:MAG: hypothetical protein CVU54_17535 [Deltaproteobacteria bacterium HGW-Deltaproteobacteria-12]PKN96942.1 MAG: hypothetical protein CVU43_18115 [Chloroflexi bacterium HGW-Chloroflexi-5]
MEIIEIKSWETYRIEMEKYSRQYEHIPILYRGHSDFRWSLKTTLERFSKSKWTLQKYCMLVIDCIRQIDTFKDKISTLPSISDIEKELNELKTTELLEIPVSISYYLTYFRHYGFPSPLLDWSRSSDIAAFFAFSENVKSKNVAIFSFVDTSIGYKVDWRGKTLITTKWLRTYPHVRHDRQQSLYTVATKLKNDDHQFESHQQVFDDVNRHEDEQDILRKYILPSTERIKVLTELDQKGINHDFLMQSDEAKLRTLAFRHIEVKNLL